MKKFIYIFSLAAFMFPTSCSDFLEEELFSDLGEGSFPADMAHAETMISEAYGRAVHAFVTHHRLGWAVEFPTPSMQLWNRRAHERQNLHTWSWGTTFTDPSYFDLLDRIWAVVRSSNDVIGLLPDADLGDEVRKEEIIGEAHFLRALCYFNCVRLWGGMPIIDKPQTLKDDLYPERASIADTYAFIISDLQMAASKLRSRSEQVAGGVPAGHATKHAALGLLAKVYLTMAGAPLNDASHLGDAKTALEQVMSSEHGLMPDFPSVFDWKNNNNQEMIFSWQLEGTEQSSYALFYFAPNDHAGDIWMPAGQQGIEYDLVPPEWVDWYRAKDSGPRFEYSIVTEYTNKDGVLRVYNAGPNEAAHVGKYRAPDYPMTQNCCDFPTDIPVLRYADVLLMYAEVVNELEGPSGAFQYINQVRERAELDPLSGLGKDELRDAIFEERMLELTYEFDMLFDMRRRGWAYTKNLMEGFYKADQNDYPNGAAYANLTVEEHEMLFPYPVNDLNANPNLKGNPGYGQD